MEFTKKMILVDPRTLDALGAPAVPDVLGQSLKQLDEEMRNVLERRELDFEDKTNMYYQTLWRYLRRLDQYRDKPIGTVNIKSPEPVGVEIKRDEAEETEPGTLPSSVEKQVMESVPRTMRKKAERLLNTMKRNPDLLRWNERGEIVHQGQVVKNSNLVDLVNDVLRKRKRAGTPPGWKPFASALGHANVPRDLIGHPDRWNYIRSQNEATPANADDFLMGSQADATPVLTPITAKRQRNVALASLKRMKEATPPLPETPFGVIRKGRRRPWKRNRKLEWSKRRETGDWETI